MLLGDLSGNGTRAGLREVDVRTYLQVLFDGISRSE